MPVPDPLITLPCWSRSANKIEFLRLLLPELLRRYPTCNRVKSVALAGSMLRPDDRFPDSGTDT
jgi:hypothetical protein